MPSRLLRGTALFLLASSLAATAAAAPVAAVSPKEARNRIAAAARTYYGVPYRYGGLDRSGLDCSGLVLLSMRDSLGASVPRTVRALYGWADPIGRKELQPGDLVFFDTVGRLTHVGVYLGEDRFIHAASAGSRTGVIESSLTEPYWSRTYSGAGRVVPAAEYLGILLSASGGASGLIGGGESLLRGASFAFGAAWDGIGVRPGVELRPEWDAALGVFRLPLTLSFGIGDEFRFFVGPALVLGDPVLERDGAGRDYAASGGLLATGGVLWMPVSFRLGPTRVSPFGEIAWQRYEPDADEADDFAADLAANFRVSAGVRVRWGL